MSNLPGSGHLVFGIANTGQPEGISEADIESIVNQLTNLGRSSVLPELALDHAVETLGGVPLLFIRIPESPVKPVHIRGKSIDQAFIRSGDTTRKTSRQEIGNLSSKAILPSGKSCQLRYSCLKPISSPHLIQRQSSKSLNAPHKRITYVC
ncbi:MAG: ATP-dependent DNA helicase RecG [Verrucomicrobiales bacterium]|jgi:ATP-dependent DNA helicase RecG